LIEPLEAAGIAVGGLGELTALAEYRNGGLPLAPRGIPPRAPLDSPARPQGAPEPIFSWRAPPHAPADGPLPLLRRKPAPPSTFAMPQLLQGGTWNAGRKIARELRPPDGPSPIGIAADGTVF